jgi:GT2 family glycosyltransferase
LTAPRVAAVVLNYCREALTVACVESLEAQQPAPEIVVVDNASPDGSGARLQARFPRHQFIQTGANLGYAGGNNRGIDFALARGAHYVLVINEDAEIDAGCIGLLVSALESDPRAGVAVPTVVHADAPDVVWWVDGFLDAKRALALHRHFGWKLDALPAALRPGASPRDVPIISGCALLMRADALRALGGFREDYINYLEDSELSVRWTRAGQRLVHVPSAIVRHKVTYPPPPPTPYQIRMRDRNRRKFARECLRMGERVAFHAWFWPSRAIIAARYVVTGDVARLRALAQGAFGP